MNIHRSRRLLRHTMFTIFFMKYNNFAVSNSPVHNGVQLEFIEQIKKGVYTAPLRKNIRNAWCEPIMLVAECFPFSDGRCRVCSQ